MLSSRCRLLFLAAICLTLGGKTAQAERATRLFETHEIHDSFPTGLAFVDLGGKGWLVTISWDGWLKRWDAETGEAGPKVRLSERRLHRLIVTPFGVAIVGGDHGLFVYDLNTDRLVARFLPTIALRQIAVHPSLPLAFATDASGKVYAIDFAAGETATWPTLGRTPTAFALTQDGETLITTDSRSVRLWSAATGQMLQSYQPLGENEPIQAVIFRPESELLYVGSGTRVTAVNVFTGTPLASLTVSTSMIVELAPGPTPGELLVASRGGEMRLWDFDLGTVKVELASDGDEGYSQWAFAPDRSKVYALVPIFNWLQAWTLDR